MPLTTGTRLGPYEVIAPLGSGGMGEVYRARDAKLHREVAIKVLPEILAADPERKVRFEREAQLLASLNHPHIGQIYGVQEVGSGGLALAMELVEGQTLATIIAGSATHALKDPGLQVHEAISIAQQIASALEAAHERGIIHRDLKPGNVMVTADGQVKVLDFGLGKALASESAHDATNSPTMTIGATQAGMILGTAAYMSPEQAKGRAADKRSDVWSFGCVLFEMLTGKRAFEGEDVSETLAAVLKQTADFSLLPKDLPPSIRLVVERCLTKDRSARLADISTARFLLTEPSALSSVTAPPIAAGGRRTIAVGAALAMVAGAIAITAITVWLALPRSADATAPATHLSIRMPTTAAIDHDVGQPVAVSADGRLVVFAGRSAGRGRLFARSLDSAEVRPIAGTEGAAYPFISPNGQWVGFFAQSKLKKASLGGGAVETVADAPNARGGAWGDDGYIYFTLSNVGVIVRVPEGGGEVTEVTRLDPATGEISHRDPQVLPGGKGLIFTVWKGAGPDEKFVAVQSAAGGSHKILVRGGTDGRYVPPGYLVYARSDDLLAVPFELATLETGKTAPVSLPVRVVGEATEGAAFAVSASGVLVYLPADPSRLARRLVWVDANGRIEPLPFPNRIYEQVSISPDGASAIVQIIDGSIGLWLLEFSRGTMTPLVTTGGSSQAPVWTRDGKRIIYRATRNGVRNLYWRAVDGSGEEERLTTKPGFLHTPSAVSTDGEWVIFTEVGAQTARAQLRLHLTGDRETVRMSPKDVEYAGQVSPDGRWLAFENVTADGVEIYARNYPGPGPSLPVSRSGGTEPLWSRDGRQLFFRSAEGVHVADVAASSEFTPSAPRLLFSTVFMSSPNGVTSYAQGKDGRLLFVQSVNPQLPPDTINIVLNLGAELGKLVK